MVLPRFRFVDDASPLSTDAEFWRDAEASDRLASRFKANLFLRELCRTKAWDGTGGSDPARCEAAERILLRDMARRGFRLFGPDLEDGPTLPLADVG